MTEYRGLTVEDTREAAADEAISQLEARLGAHLPKDYRWFLKHCNGAYLDYDVIATLASGEREPLSFSLFGLDLEDTCESNPFELEQLQSLPDFPAPGLLPIGRDGGASLLLLDLREGRQEVAAVVAGLPAWTGRHQQGDEYVILAESFDAYLDLLHLSHERILDHIDRFMINTQTIEATLQWLDKDSPGWREKYREV